MLIDYQLANVFLLNIMLCYVRSTAMTELLALTLTGDVFRSGKIPESLYSSYEQQCKKMATEILEGLCYCYIDLV